MRGTWANLEIIYGFWEAACTGMGLSRKNGLAGRARPPLNLAKEIQWGDSGWFSSA
jgi:hypothetical protein